MHWVVLYIPAEHPGSGEGTHLPHLPPRDPQETQTSDLTGVGWGVVVVCRMGPSLVIQADRKGEMDIRENIYPFDLAKPSGPPISS